MYEAYIGEQIDGYKVVDFIRLHNEVMVFKVSHVVTGRLFLMKYIDIMTAPYEGIMTFINEVRIFSSINHPLFFKYVEAFAELDKGLLWYLSLTQCHLSLREIPQPQ